MPTIQILKAWRLIGVVAFFWREHRAEGSQERWLALSGSGITFEL